MSQNAKEVFISYHTNSARDVVEKICVALEGANISCWYAPRDVQGEYAASIIDAIEGCKVFLLILNEGANASGHVLNEINCAFDRFSKHEEITLLPFQIDECKLSKDVYYYIGRIHIMDGGEPPEMLKIRELIDRINHILGRKPEKVIQVEESAGQQVREYRLVGSMVYPDNNFVGRRKELTEIYQKMTGRENKLTLIGMGGIGKSEIAKTFCVENRELYDVIVWVTFETSLEQTLSSDYAFSIHGLSKEDYHNDSEREYFLRKLKILKEIADERVLLVVDNFDVADDPDLVAFCSGRYAVLFTSRVQPTNRSLQKIEVGEMTEENDLMQLFRTEYTRTLDEEGEKWVKTILQMTQGHPLSIRLIASAMQSRRIGPEKMANLLRDGAVAMENESARAADLIFGHLRQVFRLSTLTEDEQIVLKNLALIPLRGISVETLFDWCGLEDFDVVDCLVEKNWIIHNPATDEVHLHPLVAELMAEELTKDFHCCDNLLEAMVAAREKIIGTSYIQKQQLLDLFATAVQRLPRQHPMWWKMAIQHAYVIFDFSHYEKAISRLQELADNTDDLKQKLEAIAKIAHGYCLSGKPEKGIAMSLMGLDLLQNIPEEDLDIVLGKCRGNMYGRLAEAYRDLEQYDEALEYAYKAKANNEQFCKDSWHLSIGWGNYHIARILYMRNREGDLVESEKYFRKAIALFRENKDLWSESFALEFMGQICMRQGRFAEALAESQRAYEILVPQLGKEHIDIAIDRQLCGNIYRTMGDEEQAMYCYRQARDILVQLGAAQSLDKLDKIINSGQIGYLS